MKTSVEMTFNCIVLCLCCSGLWIDCLKKVSEGSDLYSSRGPVKNRLLTRTKTAVDCVHTSKQSAIDKIWIFFETSDFGGHHDSNRGNP